MSFQFPIGQESASLTGGWEEKLAPGGWAYYTNRITKVTSLIDPRNRRYPALFMPSSSQNPSTGGGSADGGASQARKLKDDSHTKLLNQIFTIFSEETSDSIEMRSALDEYLRKQMEPRMRKILERRHRDHFDSLVRKILDTQLRTVLTPEFREKLENRLLADRRKELDKLSDEERVNLLPLVLYIPAPDPDNFAMSPISPLSPMGRRWEERWRPSEFPFVALEQHSAGCHLCLMDFDEPRRRGMSIEFSGDSNLQDLLDELGISEPEPLRLLSCGHVFHKSCVDPWLLTESKRCPYCRKDIQF